MSDASHDNAVDRGRIADISALQERLLGIIGSATDAIVTVDDDQITLVRRRRPVNFCCPAAEAIGQPLSRFIPRRFHEVHEKHIREFGETGITTSVLRRNAR